MGEIVMIRQTENGLWMYEGDTFKIVMTRYSDPHRLNLARNAARYLGKKDITNIRRPLGIIKKGHVPEIFRGEHVEFEFVDVSKEVYDHLVTYTTRNMRVAGGNRALVSDDYTLPSDKVKNIDFVKSCVEESMGQYEDLLESGETPQVARSAMPVAAKMNIFVYQFNFLTLGQSVFSQRVWDKGAQGNTVKVVLGMLALCEQIDKELWDTFYKYCGTPALRWKEVGRKLETKQITVHDFLNELHALALSGEGNPDESLLDYLDRKFGDIRSMW
jgi:hypothetical protein